MSFGTVPSEWLLFSDKQLFDLASTSFFWPLSHGSYGATSWLQQFQNYFGGMCQSACWSRLSVVQLIDRRSFICNCNHSIFFLL